MVIHLPHEAHGRAIVGIASEVAGIGGGVPFIHMEPQGVSARVKDFDVVDVPSGEADVHSALNGRQRAGCLDQRLPSRGGIGEADLDRAVGLIPIRQRPYV